MTNTFLILLPIALFLVMLMGLSLWAERAGRRNRFAGEYFLGDRSLKGFVLAMTLCCDLRIRLLLRFGARPCLATRPRLGGLRRAADHRGLSDSRRGRQEDGRRLARRGGADRHRHDPRTLRRRPGRRSLAALLAVLMLVFFTTMMIGQFIGRRTDLLGRPRA